MLWYFLEWSIRTSDKRPPLISERDHFLTWRFHSFSIVFYNVVSLIDVCTTPLEVYEKRSVKPLTRRTRNLQMASNKFYAKNEHVSWPLMGRETLWFDSRMQPPPVSDHIRI